MADIILYDLPSKDGRSWSENIWKARFPLNYKGIPYRTEWLEYPDVAPTLKAQGVPAKDAAPGFPTHTCPTVRFDAQTIIMDSAKIAPELEKRYPSPSLHLDSPILPQVEEALASIEKALLAVWMPQLPRVLLRPKSIDYFESTRAIRFGMPLPEFEKVKGGEAGWAAAKPGFDKMATLLKQNGGPFFMGNTLSYADIIFVTYIHFAKRLNKQDFERLLSHDESFGKLYQACGKWLEKDT